MKKYSPFLITFLIVLIDQIVKIWIKTNMYLEEEIPVLGNWFLIKFTENRGMAFGLELGGDIGKIVLSLFRIIAVFFIAWYVIILIRREANKGLIVSIAMILAGALGNIIDSAFYGLLFSESRYTAVAEFLPEGGGYAPFLMGSVVDMFYFPIISGYFPEWFPIWGGEHFLFFRPIFNVADASITIGVLFIFLFQRKFFNQEISKTTLQPAENPAGKEPSSSSNENSDSLNPVLPDKSDENPKSQAHNPN